MRKAFDTIVAAASVLLIIAAALLMVGCQGETPTAPGSTQTAIQTQTVIIGQPEKPPDGGGTLPPNSSVTIDEFGASCAGGGNPHPLPGQLKAGCAAIVTCTPRGPSGTPLDPSVHGPSATWGVPIGGTSVTLVVESNPFNAVVVAMAPGPAQLSCEVKGTKGYRSVTVVP